MPATLTQLRSRVDRLTPPPRAETKLFIFTGAGRIDDEVTGIETGGHIFARLPGESVEALRARSLPDGPDAPPYVFARLLYDGG